MKYFGKAESFGEHVDTYHTTNVRLNDLPTTMAKNLENGLVSDLSVTITSEVFVCRLDSKNNYNWSIKTNPTLAWRSRDEALARETDTTRHEALL